jgi:hypothetical protein
MAHLLVLVMCTVVIAVAVTRRSTRAAPADGAVRDDVPARLLRWAAGLLSARRNEWGQAMLGELDHIEGRGRRWRFAAGCVGASLLLAPWGWAAAAAWAIVAVAAGAASLYPAMVVRYGLGNWDWVFAAVALAFLVGFTLASATLLRRPRVAVPGMLGGLLVALSWLALSGFTFYGVTAPMTAKWSPLIPEVAAPVLVGVAGTLWGGSAIAGWRATRLAAITAGLGLYLYATIAVVVLGAGGPPGNTGWTVGQLVSDRLGSNVIADLAGVPLVTATIGWAAAATTAAIRARPTASVTSVQLTATGPVGAGSGGPVIATHQAARARSWRRTAYLLLLCAVVAAAVVLGVVSMLRG